MPGLAPGMFSRGNMIPINTQPVEKADLRVNGELAVHSIFYTIQGEGPFTGRPAVFVRLAGCNLQCPQCDTTYTGDGVQRLLPGKVVGIVQRLRAVPCLVVITGGEPFRQNIGPLTQLLYTYGYMSQIETNGTLPPPPELHPSATVVVSPKTGKVNAQTVERADAWKYVLSWGEVDPEDGLPRRALDHSASPRLARPPDYVPPEQIYVQPTDVQHAGMNARNLNAAIRTCQRHGYTLQIQLHKYLGME